MPSFSASFANLPLYELEGMDLVTEGVLNLNQLYNLIEDETDITCKIKDEIAFRTISSNTKRTSPIIIPAM